MRTILRRAQQAASQNLLVALQQLQLPRCFQWSLCGSRTQLQRLGRLMPAILLVVLVPLVVGQSTASDFTFHVGDVISSVAGFPNPDCDGYQSQRLGYELFRNLLNGRRPMYITDVTKTQYRILFKNTHYDDVCNGTIHAQYVNQLLNVDNIDFYFGTSALWADIDSPALEQANKLCLYCCASPPTVYRAAYTNTFGIFIPNTKYLQPMLKNMAFVDIQRVIMTYRVDGTFASSACLAAVEYIANTLSTLRPEFQIVHTIAYLGPVSPDVMGQLTAAIKQYQAEAVVVCEVLSGATNLTQAILDAKHYLKGVYVSWAPAYATYTAQFGTAVEYVTSSTQWHPAMAYADTYFGSAQRFYNFYEQVVGVAPSYAEAGAAVTGYILALAIQQAFNMCELTGTQGDVRRLLYNASAIKCYSVYTPTTKTEVRTVQVGYDLIRNALRNLQTDTFFGPIQFNSVRQNIGRDPATIQIQNGKIACVGPVEVSNGVLVNPIPAPHIQVPWAATLSGKIIVGVVVAVSCLLAGVLACFFLLWRHNNRMLARQSAAITIMDLAITLPPYVPLTGRPENGRAYYRGSIVSLVPLVDDTRDTQDRPFDLLVRREANMMNPINAAAAASVGRMRVRPVKVLAAEREVQHAKLQRLQNQQLEGMEGSGSFVGRLSQQPSDVALTRVDEGLEEVRRSLEVQAIASHGRHLQPGHPHGSSMKRHSDGWSSGLMALPAGPPRSGNSVSGGSGVFSRMGARRASDNAIGLGGLTTSQDSDGRGIAAPAGQLVLSTGTGSFVSEIQLVLSAADLRASPGMWTAVAEAPPADPQSAPLPSHSSPLHPPHSSSFRSSTLHTACSPRRVAPPSPPLPTSSSSCALPSEAQPWGAPASGPVSSEAAALSALAWDLWSNNAAGAVGSLPGGSPAAGADARGVEAGSGTDAAARGHPWDPVRWSAGASDASGASNGLWRAGRAQCAAALGDALQGAKEGSAGPSVVKGPGSPAAATTTPVAAADLLAAATLPPPQRPQERRQQPGAGGSGGVLPSRDAGALRDPSVVAAANASSERRMSAGEQRSTGGMSVSTSRDRPSGARRPPSRRSSAGDRLDFQGHDLGSALSNPMASPALLQRIRMNEEAEEECSDDDCCTDGCTPTGFVHAVRHKIRRLKSWVAGTYLSEVPLRKDSAELAWRLIRLHHPNIVTVLGVVWDWPGLDADTPVLVTEYCDFDTLSLLLENETLHLDVHKKTDIAGQIAAGMRFLHAQDPPIVHGELSLRSVMVDRYFKAKLVVPLRAMRSGQPVGHKRTTPSTRSGPFSGNSGPASMTKSAGEGGNSSKGGNAVAAYLGPERYLLMLQQQQQQQQAAAPSEAGSNTALPVPVPPSPPQWHSAAPPPLLRHIVTRGSAPSSPPLSPPPAQPPTPPAPPPAAPHWPPMAPSSAQYGPPTGFSALESHAQHAQHGTVGTAYLGLSHLLPGQASTATSTVEHQSDITSDRHSAGKKKRRSVRPRLLPHVPTNEDDVHSFGLLMLALFCGVEPPSSLGTSRSSLAEPSFGSEALSRPQHILEERLLGVHDISEPLAELIAECLAAEPHDRPCFDSICIRLEEVWSTLRCVGGAGGAPAVLGGPGGGTGGYAGALKGMTRSDDLLYELFPPKIARALQLGEEVVPERYDCVSIMFSDIVGYTEMCSQLAPHEVVDMLHRLYTRFDDLIRETDTRLFKVETIGDAFIAAGNLRQPDPSGHARSLTNFAFLAIETANQTPIHLKRPELGCINMRVGLHAGPVVGSVVGTLNKKFAIFGDAVNLASRMETMSMPNRVHCSKAFADLVSEQWTTLYVQSRGPQQIKGKGPMETFWLMKEPPATNPLANDAVANPDVGSDIDGRSAGSATRAKANVPSAMAVAAAGANGRACPAQLSGNLLTAGCGAAGTGSPRVPGVPPAPPMMGEAARLASTVVAAATLHAALITSAPAAAGTERRPKATPTRVTERKG